MPAQEWLGCCHQQALGCHGCQPGTIIEVGRRRRPQHPWAVRVRQHDRRGKVVDGLPSLERGVRQCRRASSDGEAEDDEAAHFLIGVERVRALVALVAVRAKS